MDGHAASPGDHRNPLIALSWQDDERARSHLWTRIVQCAEDGTLADALDEATAVVADLALPATVAQRLTTLLLLLTQDEPPIQHALRLAIVAGRWGARVDAEGSPAVETTVALVQRAGDCATAADPAMFSEQITGLREGLAQYCDELGQRCYGVGAFEDADRAYGAALALVRLLDETEPGTYRPLLAEHLSNIAATRAALRDYAVAQDAGEEAVRLYRLLAADRRSEHRHGLGRALNNLGKVYLEQGDPRGVAAHRETFTIYRDLPGFPDLLLAMAAANLGAALAQHGEYADAITAYREAIGLAVGAGGEAREASWPRLPETFSNLALALNAHGEFDAALKAGEEAVQIAREMAPAQDRTREVSLARCLNNLATLRLDHRALAEALPLLEDSVAIFQRLHNAGETHWDAELAGTMTNLAAAYRHQGRLTAATELYERALAMRQALARSGTLAARMDVAMTMEHIGLVLIDRRVGDRAVEALRAALLQYEALAESNPQAYRPRVAGALVNLGIAHLRAGEPALGIAACRDAIARYRALTRAHPALYAMQLAGALNTLGAALLGQGEAAAGDVYAEAADLFRLQATIARSAPAVGLVSALVNLGEARALHGDLDGAAPAYTEARERLDAFAPEPIASADLISLKWRALAGLGRCAASLERRQALFREALELAEARRGLLDHVDDRQSFQQDYQDLYREMVASCLASAAASPARRHAHRAEAWHWTERGRGRALLDLVGNPRPRLATAEQEALYARWEAAQRERERWEERLLAHRRARAAERSPDGGTRAAALPEADVDPRERALDAGLREAEQEEAVAYRAIRPTIESAPPLAQLAVPAPEALVAALRRLAPAGAEGVGARPLLVEYALLPDSGAGERYAVFALPLWGSQGVRLLVREVTLPKGKLPAAAAAFARARDTPPPARDADAAALVAWTEAEAIWADLPDTLGQHLLAPWAALLRRLRPTTIVLSTEGPLQALPIHAATMDGQPLIAHCPIVTLPMAALADELVRRRARPAGSGHWLVLGPHTLDRRAPDYLPQAREEALWLAKLWRQLPEDAQQPPYAARQMRTAVLRAQADRIAILHLATHSYFDPHNYRRSAIVFHQERLTVASLFDDRRYSLVGTILCYLSSCHGMRTGGEVAGLAFAFFCAGAECVIASIAATDDAAAARLAQILYKAWRKRGRTLAQAYQLAMIEVRAAFPHPRQWAPFVLAGNGFVPIPALLPEGEVTR